MCDRCNRVSLLDKKQALVPLVHDYLERQQAMELLDSWIERILYALHPTEAPFPFITPISLHIPNEVIATLPSPIRVSVQDIIDELFNADNMNAADVRTSDMSESTAYLDCFSADELQCLLVAMDEQLSELQQSEGQRGRVDHPESREEWSRGVEGRALGELEVETKVSEELKAIAELCEDAMEAVAVDDGRPLDKFVQLAELLANRVVAVRI